MLLIDTDNAAGRHGPRGGVRQKLAPEFPPHALVPLVRGLQPPALAPEFLPRELARPVRGVEFLARAPERPVQAPEFLPLEGERQRLEPAHGRRSPVDGP